MTDVKTNVLSRLSDLKKALHQSQDIERAVDILQTFQVEDLTPSVLKETHLGAIMRRLTKHADARISTVAGMLVKNWMKSVVSKRPEGREGRGVPLLRRQLTSGFLYSDHIFQDSGYRYNDSVGTGVSKRSKEWLSGDPNEKGPVVYWMSRDQRVRDNWALVFADRKARLMEQPLVVVFCLFPNFLGATIRQYGFMLRGLRQVERDLRTLNIHFEVLLGDPVVQIAEYCKAIKAGCLVTDFSPLRSSVEHKTKLSSALPDEIEMHEVDAHNIVPAWKASNKLEYAARTFRPKLHDLLESYLSELPSIEEQDAALSSQAAAAVTGEESKAAGLKAAPRVAGFVDWASLLDAITVDDRVDQVEWAAPGERSASAVLAKFLGGKLGLYNQQRHDPLADGLSGLSPYIHFGQISAQRIVLEVFLTTKQHIDELFTRSPQTGPQVFVDQLVVRRELAENFCYYSHGSYDTLTRAPDWARQSLAEHKNDRREHVYTEEQFEYAQTHERLWNATQLELVHKGKMHSYARMYWAKQILNWSESPEEALRIAIFLNDKYELDGRDPNGYVGCLWAIAGLHDQETSERPIFGKVRYMSRVACERKFNVGKYETQQMELRDAGAGINDYADTPGAGGSFKD